MSVKELIEKYLEKGRKWKKINNDEYILIDKDVRELISLKLKEKWWIVFVNSTPKYKASSLDDAKTGAELFIH